jgi:thymidylate synthase
MEFDLRYGFPLLTTKEVWFKGIIEELLFFISGKTDTKILEAKGVNIWKDNTSREFLESRNLNYREGDIGKSYPYQWRHCGAEYKGCDEDYTNLGVDQLQNVINSIKNDPYGRRHIISSWDVCNIDKMALPPCHCMVQFFVGKEENLPKYLDCCMYQRSADMFLGVPFNIASYALLTIIIAHLTNLKPRYYHHVLGDAHIYLNHIDQVKEQIGREPYPFPTVTVNTHVESIDDFKLTDFTLQNYRHHPKLNGKMAV